ncbi:MAG: hypothetical protein L6R36_004380 [Xanthoria steineri]|nr:MAG: hypothetical protein L6R36_004380 [Xanthoria steineri]
MKVAENSIIDLDILPGKGEGDVLGQAQAMANNPNIPPEQREKAKGIVANMQGVAGGVAGTVGGGVKGVVDTAGNTVGTLGSGLAGTVGGVAGGLGDTVKSGGGMVSSGLNYMGGTADEGAEKVEKGAAEGQSKAGQMGEESKKRVEELSKGAEESAKSAKSGHKPSPLARQNNISASTERDIHEAFTLFASSSPSEPEQTFPSSSLAPALKALGLKCPKREVNELLDAADPDASGSIPYTAFLAVAALKLKSVSSGDNDEGQRQAEIEEAFQLFLGEGKGVRKEEEDEGGEVITMQTLKRVAKVLKEDVDEKVLRDMILEANGGAGVRKGVGREEFGEVMRRAGVLK